MRSSVAVAIAFLNPTCHSPYLTKLDHQLGGTPYHRGIGTFTSRDDSCEETVFGWYKARKQSKRCNRACM